MLTAGCDVGSLTAEAVIMEGGMVHSAAIRPVEIKAEPGDPGSAFGVLKQAGEPV